MSAESPEDRLEALLEHLRTSRGIDFSGYKRASLARRIEKRIQAVGAEGYGQYLDRLEVDPSEYEQLFNYILINVTSFFRDTEIWDYLRDEVIPRLLARRQPPDVLRIWCAGCASGEEAYSMAILFAEVLGIEQALARVKIYATDIDLEALTAARQGTYPARQVESVPARLLERYFEQSGGEHTVDRRLRRMVIFGRHDLIQDAPISHVDILSCRNTLMYFNSEAQAKIMSRFYFALNEDGVMVLGKAEMTSGYGRAFTAVNIKRRVFAPGPRHGARDRLMLPAQDGDREALGQLTNSQRAGELAFEAAPAAQIVVDREGMLVMANARARELFGLQSSDLGRPFHELELSWRPPQLQALIETAQRDQRRTTLSSVSWHAPGEHVYLDIDVLPLREDGRRVLGVVVHFFDVSHERSLRDELEQSNQELETAIQELHSTNEELETTNEELQSTNEELETTNEELQSTNEELETMNEELQSTNEELQATNDELRSRTGELNQLNRFLETLMASVKTSVIVVDESLRIQLWNRQSAEMWGLRTSEVVGTPFLGADIGLPRDSLAPAIMACLRDRSPLEEFEVDAVNRRGRPIRCRVAITPMDSDGAGVVGAILLIEQFEHDGAGAPGRAAETGTENPAGD